MRVGVEELLALGEFTDGIVLQVRAKCEGKCSYRLTGAFFLKSNSLRLNYRPMTVPLDGGSFKDCEIPGSSPTVVIFCCIFRDGRVQGY